MTPGLYRYGQALAAVAMLGLLLVLSAQPGSPARVTHPAGGFSAPMPAVVEEHTRGGFGPVRQHAGGKLTPLDLTAALSAAGVSSFGAAALMFLGLALAAATRLQVRVLSLWRRAERAPPGSCLLNAFPTGRRVTLRVDLRTLHVHSRAPGGCR